MRANNVLNLSALQKQILVDLSIDIWFLETDIDVHGNHEVAEEALADINDLLSQSIASSHVNTRLDNRIQAFANLQTSASQATSTAVDTTPSKVEKFVTTVIQTTDLDETRLIPIVQTVGESDSNNASLSTVDSQPTMNRENSVAVDNGIKDKNSPTVDNGDSQRKLIRLRPEPIRLNPDENLSPPINNKLALADFVSIDGQSAVSVNLEQISWSTLQQQLDQQRLSRIEQYPDFNHDAILGVGNQTASILVVVDPPNQQIQATASVIVDEAKTLLTSGLAACNLEMTEVYLTNIVKFRPLFDCDPSQQECQQGRATIAAQIALIRPTVLISFGRIASQVLLQTQAPLGKLRQQQYFLSSDSHADIPMIMLSELDYYLRLPAEKYQIWQGLKLMVSSLQSTASKINQHD